MEINVIKRDGRKVPFDKKKIENAILAAMNDVGIVKKKLAEIIADEIEDDYRTIDSINALNNKRHTDVDIEEIQDSVEDYLMDYRENEVAKAYIKYRYDKEKSRALRNEFENRFHKVKKLIDGNDKESQKENSNKDTRIVSTMRDYIAGFTCREMAKEIFPDDIWKAHEEGIIHIHDTDYSPLMPISNCGLVNLEDMLQNGTVISETLIERPKSFKTACTVTSQIVAQVASSQYGLKR